MVSDAFIQFMYRRQELSDFVSFYHEIAKKAIGTNEENYDQELYEKYRGNSVFFLENYICRISDLFDIYLEDLIFVGAEIKSDFFSGAEKAKVKSRLNKLGIKDVSEISVISEAASNLARKNKIDIVVRFREAIGFDMEISAKHWQRSLLCNRIRNLIVHRGSVVDQRFHELTKESALPFEVEIGKPLLIPEILIMDLASKVDDCIWSIDGMVSDFVNVPKRNRYGHFWIARSGWSKPSTGEGLTS